MIWVIDYAPSTWDAIDCGFRAWKGQEGYSKTFVFRFMVEIYWLGTIWVFGVVGFLRHLSLGGKGWI